MRSRRHTSNPTPNEQKAYTFHVSDALPTPTPSPCPYTHVLSSYLPDSDNSSASPPLLTLRRTLPCNSTTLKYANNMSSTAVTSGGDKPFGFPKTSDAPGEQFEPRQTATSEDYTPDASKSIPLSPARQRLVDDVSRAADIYISVLILLPDCCPVQLPADRLPREALHAGLRLRRPIRLRQ
jgi:hypothetical protein